MERARELPFEVRNPGWDPHTRRQFDRFKAEALRIAKKYEADKAEQAKLPSSIGTRRVVRRPLGPRDQAVNVFKRAIYALGCDLYDRGMRNFAESYVRARDEKWGIDNRPRNPTEMDWAVRLVRGIQLGPLPKVGIRVRKFLFDDVTASRLIVELNFAFRHWIAPDFVNMFVADFGGHEIISARLKAGEYDLRKEDWVRPLQRHGGNPFEAPDNEEEGPVAVVPRVRIKRRQIRLGKKREDKG